MNTNVSGKIYIFLIYVLPILSVLACVAVLIKSIYHYKKTGSNVKLKYNIISVICTILVAVSYVLNIGWLRVIGLWFGIPFIHGILFVIANSLSAEYVNKSSFLRITVVLTYITYLLGYTLLPDFTDTGTHVFFGLIHNDMVISVCGVVVQNAFILNIICIIGQFIIIPSIKKSKME